MGWGWGWVWLTMLLVGDVACIKGCIAAVAEDLPLPRPLLLLAGPWDQLGAAIGMLSIAEEAAWKGK